jgi:hypothetical protein
MGYSFVDHHTHTKLALFPFSGTIGALVQLASEAQQTTSGHWIALGSYARQLS